MAFETNLLWSVTPSLREERGPGGEFFEPIREMND